MTKLLSKDQCFIQVSLEKLLLSIEGNLSQRPTMAKVQTVRDFTVSIPQQSVCIKSLSSRFRDLCWRRGGTIVRARDGTRLRENCLFWTNMTDVQMRSETVKEKKTQVLTHTHTQKKSGSSYLESQNREEKIDTKSHPHKKLFLVDTHYQKDNQFSPMETINHSLD